MSDIRLFVAVKAFIMREGKLLMLREASTYQDGTNLAKYDLPGGRIEPQEKLEEALAREVKEEISCVVQKSQAFAAGEWWPKKNGELWHICGIYYAVKIADDHKISLSGDHDGYVWADIDNPPDNTIEMWRPVLAQHAAFLKSF